MSKYSHKSIEIETTKKLIHNDYVYLNKLVADYDNGVVTITDVKNQLERGYWRDKGVTLVISAVSKSDYKGELPREPEGDID